MDSGSRKERTMNGSLDEVEKLRRSNEKLFAQSIKKSRRTVSFENDEACERITSDLQTENAKLKEALGEQIPIKDAGKYTLSALAERLGVDLYKAMVIAKKGSIEGERINAELQAKNAELLDALQEAIR